MRILMQFLAKLEMQKASFIITCFGTDTKFNTQILTKFLTNFLSGRAHASPA